MIVVTMTIKVVQDFIGPRVLVANRTIERGQRSKLKESTWFVTLWFITK